MPPRFSRSLLQIACLLLYSVKSYSQDAIEIWMRAFIPNSANAGAAYNYIQTAPNGNSFVRLLGKDLTPVDQCFLTDNRGFSSNGNLTSRLETKFTIYFSDNGNAYTLPSDNRTTAFVTSKLDCATGAVVETKIGSVDRDNIGTPAVAGKTVQVIGQVQGRNLLTPLGRFGPSIDYSFDIQWQKDKAQLIARVSAGSFPAFEMYARQKGGSWIPVIQHLPSGNPWNLAGDAFGVNLINLSATIKIGTPKASLDLSGNYSGSCDWRPLIDPVTLVLTKSGSGYIGRHTSKLENQATSELTDIVINENSRTIRFKMFGINYTGTFSVSGSQITLEVKGQGDYSPNYPVCTYRKS